MASSELEFYPLKFFKWEKIGTSISQGNTFKTHDNKNKKSWKTRFVALYYNYVVFFENGKGPKGAPTDKAAEAKNVFALEKLTERNFDIVAEKEGFSFSFATSDDSCTICAETENLAFDWSKIIKSLLDQIEHAEKRVSGDEAIRKLKDVQAIFPESNFKMPIVVTAEDGDKYLNDLKNYREEYKKVSPYVHSLALFAEYQAGRVKGYHQWFTNKSKGVSAMLAESEDRVTKDWTEKITKSPKDMQIATETMFFLEDLQTVIEDAQKYLRMVDLMNRYHSELLLDNTPKFEQEKQLISAWLQKLKSYPNSQDVSMAEFSDGILDSDEEKWAYNSKECEIKRVSSSLDTYPSEDITFSCKGHHCQFVNNLYGIVLWNGKSFVWTHPRCPFIIRYDWYPTKGVLKQYWNPDAPKNPKIRPPPSLTDWQLTKDVIRAVTVGKRDPIPEVPDITSWRVQGNIPPPAILLAAIFRHIRPIVRGILKLDVNQGYVATGLNPIF